VSIGNQDAPVEFSYYSLSFATDTENCHRELSTMTASPSPIQKFVFTPLLLSATVFGVLTLPLAVLGSKPVIIQLQKEQVFQGHLKDFATPYLTLASALSLGTGIASVAVAGWREESRKSSQVEAQLSTLAQNLQEKEAQLEALKLSESRNEVSPLSAFLDEQVTPQQVEKTPVATIEAVPVIEPLVITTQPLEAQPVAPHQVTVQEAVRHFASAQTFLGYTRPKSAVKATPREISLESSEVEQLHTQLQQLMVQMASVQTALSARTNTVTSEAQVSSDKKAVVPASWVELQVVKCWSGENMAS
jgi:hypothetical protein